MPMTLKLLPHWLLAAVLFSMPLGCRRALDPPPASATITQSTFEPVYRASKSVQGAISSGVSYIKFGELLQGFSTEISIARDHELNSPDRDLLRIYQEARDTYKFSATLWNLQIETAASDRTISLPSDEEHEDPALAAGIVMYELKPFKLTTTHGTRRALPADSIQRVWQHADETLARATKLYYGRPTSK